MKSQRILLILTLVLATGALAPTCERVPDARPVAPQPDEAEADASTPRQDTPGPGEPQPRIQATVTVTQEIEGRPAPIVPAPGPWELGAAPSAAFAQAEAEFAKKNYRRAAEAYEAFVAAEPRHPDVPRAQLRRAECRLNLREFDEALAVLADQLAGQPGTLWAARTLVARAALWPRLPSWAMRYGGEIHYNQEHREGEHVTLWQVHRDNVVEDREAARRLFQALLGRPPAETGARPGDDVLAETLASQFALVEAVQATGQGLHDPPPPAPGLAPPAATATYRPDWPGRTKILFLLDEVGRLVESAPDATPRAAARYRKALFLSRFPEAPTKAFLQAEQERVKAHARQYEGRPAPQYVPGVFDPGPGLDPVALLDRNLAELPDHENADLWLGFKGRVLESRIRFAEAAALYERFLKRFPQSRYRGDVSARNLQQVRFSAYRVDLHQVLGNRRNRNNPDRPLDSIESFGKNVKQLRARFLSSHRRVASWTYDPADPGDLRPTTGRARLALPADETGAYLVWARGTQVEQVFLVVRTDLIVVQRQDRAKVHYLVTDSASGQPRAGIPLLVKEVYYRDRPRWRAEARTAELVTDARGRATHTLKRGPHISGNRAQVLAHATGQRFALTRNLAGLVWWSGAQPEQYKVFSTTDRPVYRPGDTVRFKHVVRLYQEGRNSNVPGVQVRVQVLDAKGAKLLDEEQTTDAFGTVHGEVAVPGGAPLGVYRARLEVVGAHRGTYQSAGSQFRVEEYKKPEFEVTVAPAADLVRPGQPVAAEIQARYYFGAPVVGGKVRYTVTREVYWHQHHRPSRYDWLYGPGFGVVHERRFQTPGQELIAEGRGVTDAQGSLTIELPAAEQDAKYDFRYTVVAEVTDLSRRLIKGEGSVKVTRDPFYLFLFTDQGFYSPGDTVALEVNARTATDAPVAAQGELIVERLEYPAGESERATEVHRAPLTCDAAGRAVISWASAEPGQYRLKVQARQTAGAPLVEQSQVIAVVAERFPGARFRFREVGLRTEKRTYLRGETIRLLVTTPYAPATVWLTLEGGDELFEERLLTLEDGSTVLEIPATETLAPNFFARAIVVHDHVTHATEREVFIPPGEEILDVTLTADRAEYRPREPGAFTVEVRDHQGQPVAAQLALSVFDSSVLYIQRETAGDVRPYYYGQRRYLGLQQGHSGSLGFWAFSRNAFRGKKRKFKAGGLPSAHRVGHGWGRGRGYGGAGGQTVLLDAVDESAEVATRSEAGGYRSPPPAAEPVMTASPASRPRRAARRLDKAAEQQAMTGANLPDGMGAPTVREHFADTALWAPAVETGPDGTAEVTLDYPDSLTTWAVRGLVVDVGSRVGTARLTVKTTKNLVARLETPRFLVEGDELSLAAMVNNRFDHPVTAELALAVEGGAIEIVGAGTASVTVPANEERRVDFAARAVRSGEARITLTAKSPEEGDALVKPVPVLVYGAERMLAQGSVLRQPGAHTLEFDVPAARQPEQTELVVVAEPSLAGVLVQALPYLVEYPYGCVEQTVSRFLPAVLVRKTLQDLGVTLADLAKPPAEGTLASPVSRQLAPPWRNPVYREGELGRVITKGLKRLLDFQHGDGGWAWWRHGDSDPYMTAYVVLGLTEAREADVHVPPRMINRGLSFLRRAFDDPDEYPGAALRAYMAYVLGRHGRIKARDLDGLYAGRDDLAPYGKSLLALALHLSGDAARAKQVVENLVDLAWDDPDNGTAAFKLPTHGWWWWYHDRVETVAWGLRAFLRIAPEHPLTERLARWLVLNRQGNRWYSTKDTATSISTLVTFMQQRGELDPDATLVVEVNGREVRRVEVTRENLLRGAAVVVLQGEAVPTGKLQVTTRLEGKQGAAYTAAFLTYVSQEETISASGNEIFVQRQYFKLTPKQAKRKTWRGEITVREYDRAEVQPGAPLTPGELLEVKLTIEAKNDYEYLVFEDHKPAGCEPEALKSGGEYKHGAYANKELRDETVVFFLDRLRMGTQVLTYRLHAQIPGSFHALPLQGYAMYAPRVRANSESRVVGIGAE